MAGDWVVDMGKGRLTCVIHGAADCTKCPPPAARVLAAGSVPPERSGGPKGPQRPDPPRRNGIRVTPPAADIAKKTAEILGAKRDQMTMATAFKAYDAVLEQACAILAIQHARLVDLEARVAQLEADGR